MAIDLSPGLPISGLRDSCYGVPGSAHSKTKRFHDYWLSLMTSPGVLPAEGRFDPAAVPDLAENLSMIRVEQPLRLRFERVAPILEATYRRGFAGRYFDEIFPDLDKVSDWFTRYLLAMRSDAPIWRRGPLRYALDPELASAETCLFPFSNGGDRAELLVSVSIFQDREGNDR
jgi:hypothetical protein